MFQIKYRFLSHILCHSWCWISILSNFKIIQSFSVCLSRAKLKCDASVRLWKVIFIRCLVYPFSCQRISYTAWRIFTKLCTHVCTNMKMCMKEYKCCPTGIFRVMALNHFELGKSQVHLLISTYLPTPLDGFSPNFVHMLVIICRYQGSKLTRKLSRPAGPAAWNFSRPATKSASPLSYFQCPIPQSRCTKNISFCFSDSKNWNHSRACVQEWCNRNPWCCI